MKCENPENVRPEVTLQNPVGRIAIYKIICRKFLIPAKIAMFLKKINATLPDK
jgi:hypothetical protein